MRAIIGAVNKFKGEWDDGKDFIYFGTKLNGIHSGEYQFTYHALTNDTWDLICDESQFNQCCLSMATNYGTSETYADYKANYTAINDDMEALIVKSVFTQEMFYAGTLPSVGMELMIKEEHDLNYVKATIKYISSFTVVYDRGVNSIIEDCLDIDKCNYKPLTPPIKLIDGKAYQFEARNKTLQGIYCDNNETMNIHQSYYFNLEVCTKIQLLEVK